MLFLRKLRTTRTTRTDARLPYTTLIRSQESDGGKDEEGPDEFLGEWHGVARIGAQAEYASAYDGLVQVQFACHHQQDDDHGCPCPVLRRNRSEEHTSELQPLMRISYAVFCLQKKNHPLSHHHPLRH